MNIKQRAAVQRCMDQMGEIGTVIAALFSTNSPDGVEDFRFEVPGDRREIREAIAKLQFRFKAAGRAEFLNEEILVSGEPLRLLVSTYQGMGYKPFMIAAVKVPDDAFELQRIRHLMEKVATSCIKRCDSSKWS